MQHQEFEPSGELRDAIKCFWYTQMNFGEHPSSFEVVPDGYAEIIFYFGSPCTLSIKGGSQPLPAPMPSPFLMGLLNLPTLLTTKNRLQIIGVRCFPWTVFDLLGLPSGKDSVRTFEHPIAALQSPMEAWITAGKIKEAVAQVQQYFLDVRSGVTADRLLLQAGVAMKEANGTLPVGQIAAAAHTTVRTLERKFKQSSGHTVKDVSGLMRFEQARNRLWCCPNSNLAALAQELGYSDQSHLSREFKRYSCATPADFAQKAKRTVSRDFVAFIQEHFGVQS